MRAGSQLKAHRSRLGRPAELRRVTTLRSRVRARTYGFTTATRRGGGSRLCTVDREVSNNEIRRKAKYKNKSNYGNKTLGRAPGRARPREIARRPRREASGPIQSFPFKSSITKVSRAGAAATSRAVLSSPWSSSSQCLPAPATRSLPARAQRQCASALRPLGLPCRPW